MATAALEGDPVLDLASVREARRLEQDQADGNYVVAHALDYSSRHLIDTVRSNAAEVIAALQLEHTKAVAVIVRAHQTMPPGTDGDKALDEGGKTRTAWLAMRDGIARAETLAAAVDQVAGFPRGYDPEADLYRWVRDRLVVEKAYGNGDVMIAGKPVRFGLPLYRALAQAVPDPAGWWAPTPTERLEAYRRHLADNAAEQARRVAAATRSGAGAVAGW